MQASEILQTASAMVGGERQQQHGDKMANHAAIAAMLNGYLSARALSGRPPTLAAHEVADIMEVLKVARRLNGAFNLDDYIDAAGYAAIAGELRSVR